MKLYFKHLTNLAEYQHRVNKYENIKLARELNNK